MEFDVTTNIGSHQTNHYEPKVAPKPSEQKSIRQSPEALEPKNEPKKKRGYDEAVSLLTENTEVKGDVKDLLDRAIEIANKKLFALNRSAQYSIHEKTKQIMVKIVDTESGETIREIPPEKSLDVLANMWELTGIFLDERK